MNVLDVENLRKVYPAFTLDGVSFHLEKGKITGFIGVNGAGKSTTLKSVLGFVKPDGGAVRFFGAQTAGATPEAKQRIGFLPGAVDYYPKKKLSAITAVTRSFYENWDEAAYEKYLALFRLDERKTPSQLSAGMKVKYALALALSHGAELLILDEPTSGLDPVSRDDLLSVFLELSRGGKTILFSTHITSDLDSCADNIIYIRGGRIVDECSLKDFSAAYRAVELSEEKLPEGREKLLIGAKISKNGRTALVRAADAEKLGVPTANADLEQIMIHLEKEGASCSEKC